MTKYASDAQKKALTKYRNEKIDRIEITVPAGRKEAYKNAATAAGMSLNAYIVQCIENAVEGPEKARQDV